MEKEVVQLVVFTLAGRECALHLEEVERVLLAVAATPLPQGPEIAPGLINLQGRITPVLDIRRRFRLPATAPGLYDHLIIARTSRRLVALQVDQVRGVVAVPAREVVATRDLLPGVEYVRGVVKLADGLVLIHDLEGFLSLEEARALDQALGGQA